MLQCLTLMGYWHDRDKYNEQMEERQRLKNK